MKTVDFAETIAGHMTKLAAKPIYGKNPSKIFFSGTGGPISTKLSMLHSVLQPIIVYYNPHKLCLWEGILFSRCPSVRTSDRPNVCP